MLSIAINVKNGANYLPRCLNALSKFNDIVILDNYSSDGTPLIAKRYPNVRFFQAEFHGMGHARNLLAKYAKYDWLLFIDCDEVLNPQLVKCLLNFKFEDKHVYQLHRYNFYAKTLIDSSSWGNDWVTRIYNRKQTSYMDTDVHESVITNGLTIDKITSSFIFHFPYNSISELISKMQFYSTLYAKQNLNAKHTNLYLLPLRSCFVFFKSYIIQGGFKQGYEGFVISSFNAIGVFVKYLKLYEISNELNINLVISGINSIQELSLIITNINMQHLLPKRVIILISPELLISYSKAYLSTLFNSELVVPYSIIESSNSYIGQAINDYLSNSNDGNDYLIEPMNLDVLNNSFFLKTCKSKLVKAKPIKNVKIHYKTS